MFDFLTRCKYHRNLYPIHAYLESKQALAKTLETIEIQADRLASAVPMILVTTYDLTYFAMRVGTRFKHQN